MFKTVISNTAFTTEEASECFTNINGCSYANDVSFLSTLRALLANRVKDDKEITLYFTSSAIPEMGIKGCATTRICSVACQVIEDFMKDSVIIHDFRGSDESNDLCFKAVKERFCEQYKGFSRLDKVEAFYQKSFRVDCYANPEANCSVVFVDHLDLKKLHYLQVSILAILPWYLDKEKGITQLERDLLQSLRGTSPQNYLDCLAQIAEQFDFRERKIRKKLAGFEACFEQKRLRETERNIARYDERITNLNAQISDFLRQKNEQSIVLLGLKQKVAMCSDESEIMDYFLCNPHLYLNATDGDQIEFSVKEYLTYFDREMAESAIENDYSFVYPFGLQEGQTHNGITEYQMKKLMNEIFVNEEPRLRIRFWAIYRLGLTDGIRAQSKWDRAYDQFPDAMPNTHIYMHSCMGNYTTTINQMLQNFDYIGAIEQCIASCKSLNFGDGTVMEEFMRGLWGEGGVGNTKCIELPDGSVVKPKEAIKWLEAQDRETVVVTSNEEETDNE